MLSKFRKIFFNSMFVILYASFLCQLVYILVSKQTLDTRIFSFGLLSFEWLLLILARYFYRKSNSNNNSYNKYRR